MWDHSPENATTEILAKFMSGPMLIFIYLFTFYLDTKVVTGKDIMLKYLTQIPASRTHLCKWINEGKLKPIEYVVEGFENTPKAFVEMFQGKNFGKAVVKV